MPAMSADQRLKYHRTEVWTDAADVQVIKTLKTRYAKLAPNAGTITTTAIVRRALRHLDSHMRTVKFPKACLAEVAAMAEVINSR